MLTTVNSLEKMNSKEAKQYINYGIKEGHFSPEDFEGMGDKDLIAFADRADSAAELEADNSQEDAMEMARDTAEENAREQGLI